MPRYSFNSLLNIHKATQWQQTGPYTNYTTMIIGHRSTIYLTNTIKWFGRDDFLPWI
jgi:hypothetical protein